MEEILNKEAVVKGAAVKLDHYIVAIGASAGGLEAIHEFFDNMPENSNLSFIVIQHLSPDYKSLLVELVSKHTHMKVFEAGDKMTIQKECVYIIPNRKLMTIHHGKLHLVEKGLEKAPNTAIDHFLHTLAREKKDKAIAIILSGTGTDGTKGIEAIKGAGGLVIVQDPVTAKFDGMPNSAITSGNADFILPPELMPEEIYHHTKQTPIQILNKGKVDERLLDEIFTLIHEGYGYDFHYYKTPTIVRRIAKRMGQRGLKKLPDYVEFLRSNPEEVKGLAKDFLIGVTRFFRDQPAFDSLYNDVLPSIINSKKDHDFLKVWICACSTGEEAYSIAILIDQYLQRYRKVIDVKIFATDIDEKSTSFAARNLYPLSIEKDIDEEVLAKYFVKEGAYFSVIPRIRKQIVFATHNVIKDPPFIKNDLVSCRNMLIYMNSVLQQKILGTLHFSLNMGGYLLLGSSETPSSIKDGLDEINSKWKIFRKVGKNKAAPHQFYRQLDERSSGMKQAGQLIKNEYKASGSLLQEFTDSIVEDFGYVCFYVDNGYEIKDSIGNFNRFLSLPDKKLNLNILKMVPQELSIALNSAIRKSWKENTKVFLKSVRLKQNGTDLYVSVSVRPPQANVANPYTLIVLGENSLSQMHMTEESSIVPSHPSDYVSELEAELSETRSNLQMAVEGLETTNEELQSSNEELLSANEELQSSNEELQSLNEELHTLNTEHQLKIKELIELNDDLNNYFRSTDIGQIFLDGDQRIRKFNTAAVKMINLIDSDIGRPIGHISTNIRYDFLLKDIQRVLDTDELVEKEIVLYNENRCLMRIMPYLRQDKKSDGAIITFVDISAITNLNSIINGVFNSSLSAILAFKTIRNFENRIEDFLLLTSNYAAQELLKDSINLELKKLSQLQAIGKGFLFEKFVHVVTTEESFQGEYLVEDDQKQWYSVVAVKMMDGIVVTFTNISDQRAAEQKLRTNFNELIAVRENLKRLNIELEDKVAERTKKLSESEERFRLVSNATNDAIWDWTFMNNQIWWSENFYTQFGYKDEPEISSPALKFDKVHPEDRKRVSTSIYDAINNTKKQWSEEYRYQREDGSYAFVLDRAFVLHDEYGTPFRMLGSMLDITELKEAEQKILNSESRFRRVFESNMIGMVFTNKNGVITNANQAFLDMTGFSDDDLENNQIFWEKITPPESQEKNRWAAEQLKNTGILPVLENEYVRKDGKRINVLLGAASVSEDEAVAVTYIIDITDQKEAERKELELQKVIERQQEEFRRIFMDAPALISIRRGADLEVDFVNKAVIDYFGRSDLKSKPIKELQAEYQTANSEAEKIIKEVYETGIPFLGKAHPVEYAKNRDGEMVKAWFDLVYQPVFDSEGKVDGVATFAFDVSDMIMANEEIKKSSERFKFLADAIPQKVWTALPDGRGDYFNKVWTDYTGKSFDELVGEKWIESIHPDDREKNRLLWQNSIDTGEVFEMERRLLSASGEYRWHLSRCIPYKDEKGKIVLWVGSSTDIQDQKAISEALRESEDYFRQLADQSPFMIWRVGKNGHCNYVNRQWIEFTGLSFESSLGLGWTTAFHPDDTDNGYGRFLEAFNERNTYNSKFRIRSIKGDYHWVLAQANPVTGPTFEGYIGSLTDITEQELAQQAMKLLMHKKDEFMSIASHELKTPITSMKANLQVAERLSRKNAEAEKVQLFIQKANKQVNKLTSLVEDLLDVTKIQAGKLQFNKTTFNIDEAIVDCVEEVQSEAVTPQILIEGDKGVRVEADKHRLEQVLINFLSNAIKYSPDADKVILKVRNETTKVVVSITDFGIGIPKDKIDFVFDRFFRVQESSQKFSGLGLGLFISSEIIKRHNGDVGVISKEGEGSTFWFSLPVGTLRIGVS